MIKRRSRSLANISRDLTRDARTFLNFSMKMRKFTSLNSNLDLDGIRFLNEMVKGFEGVSEYIQHDYDRLNFIPSADYLIVEGTSQGRMSGHSWAGGKTPGGRFCNVFKFRDGRILSLHIYLDPDYTGEDEARFRWGKNRKW